MLLLRKTFWQNAGLPVVALGPLGFMLLIALQVALGRVPYPEQALTAALYLSWAVLLMLLARALRRELEMTTIAETLAWFTLAGGVLSALIGLLQHYESAGPLDFMVARKGSAAVYGNLGQPNHYASYLTLALASAAYLYGRFRLRAAVAAPLSAWLLLMVALSGSRSAWLYLCMLILLAWSLRRSRGDIESRRLSVFTFWLLGGFVAAQWVATLPALQGVTGTLTSAQRLFESASGIESRLQLGREAWRMFVESPLTGAGYGQFAWHHFLWAPPEAEAAAPGVFHHAHNFVLQLMAETGLAGACLVAGALLFWLWGIGKGARDLEWWWVVGMVAVIALHSLLEYPLWYSYFLGIAALLLGLGATHVLAIGLAGIGRGVAALALALGWLNLVAIIAPYRNFERLVFEKRGDAAVAGERAFGDAVMQIHREPLLRPYVELAITFGIKASGEDLREKLELNARVLRFAPIADVVLRQVLLLQLAGEAAPARRLLELAARAYPGALEEFSVEVAQLARSRPAEFLPLLELVAAESVELRARKPAP